MQRLFLDANVFLDFYRFGDDDISEVDKLRVLVSEGDVDLVTNSHLLDEIGRNREGVISKSLSELRQSKLQVRAPNYCKKDATYTDLSDQLKRSNKLLQKLIAELEEKIQNKDLAADKLIGRLLESSSRKEVTSDFIDKAERRVALRNPPGKIGSLGDAIHWECLIAASEVNSLSIVSRDSDFSSEMDKNLLKGYLADEWGRKKKYGSVKLYTSLSEYFGELFPQIKLSDEANKQSLISQLETSSNFAYTHAIIAELSGFTYFTANQVRRLFAALLDNTQVRWIVEDDDVRDFYLKLEHRAHVVSSEYHDEIASLLDVEPLLFFLDF